MKNTKDREEILLPLIESIIDYEDALIIVNNWVTI